MTITITQEKYDEYIRLGNVKDGEAYSDSTLKSLKYYLKPCIGTYDNDTELLINGSFSCAFLGTGFNLGNYQDVKLMT